MNIQQLLPVLVLALAGNAALAQEIDPYAEPVATLSARTASTLTRAEVKADFKQSVAENAVVNGEDTSAPVAHPAASGLTRAEVREEARLHSRAQVRTLDPLNIGG